MYPQPGWRDGSCTPTLARAKRLRDLHKGSSGCIGTAISIIGKRDPPAGSKALGMRSEKDKNHCPKSTVVEIAREPSCHLCAQ